jgi:saccharopine dehydrogenase (NAD+, L-lysine-forming)
MSMVLIIGDGGVGSVVTQKYPSSPEVFSEIMLASRTKAKSDVIAALIKNKEIKTAQVDADNVSELVE